MQPLRFPSHEPDKQIAPESSSPSNLPHPSAVHRPSPVSNSLPPQTAASPSINTRNRAPSRQLGEILIEWGLIDEDQLVAALAAQQSKPKMRLGSILIEQGVLTEDDVTVALAEKFSLPLVDLDDITLDITALEGIHPNFIRHHGVLPISTSTTSLTVVVADPLALDSIDILRFSTGKTIREVLANPSQLATYLETYLSSLDEGKNSDLQLIMQEVETDIGPRSPSNGNHLRLDKAESGVTKLVNRMIVDAVNRNASDIHVEPNGTELDTTVRFRVDGECTPYWRIPGPVSAQVVSRIKIMAKLDITDRTLPQDGKICFLLGSQRRELRVATIPTLNRGEDVVMRVLGSGPTPAIGALDLSPHNRARLERLITEPYGMILAVGPTGSGKTTTLHAMLAALNKVERKIWTAEDPVEITQPGLRQVQVDPERGFDFARALRAFLRGDPDVIMVGEMRDIETASVAVEASLTGHLLLSTLHTNSAPETVTRLAEMGVEAFTFSDALLGILAQRLTRRLCTSCRQEALPTAAERALIVRCYGESELAALLNRKPLTLWKAIGCPSCDDKGYRGRLALHEILVKNDAMGRAIQRGAKAAEVRDLAIAGGMRTLIQDGIEKSIAGLTDLQQVLAVVGNR